MMSKKLRFEKRKEKRREVAEKNKLLKKKKKQEENEEVYWKRLGELNKQFKANKEAKKSLRQL